MSRFFRLTCPPGERLQVEALLQAEGFTFRPDPDLDGGYTLTSEPKSLGASVAATFGFVYILDRSSMLPPLCLAPGPGETVLDLCASPGSKTGVLARLTGETGLVVANEPNRKRYQTLRRNLAQMNLAQVVTTGYGAESYPGRQRWDRILLDVPCSGWGTAEKHPKVLSVWREKTLKPLIGLQQRILDRAAAMLAPGGRMVYSTCTTNKQENEDQILRLLPGPGSGLELEQLPAFPGYVYDPPQDPGAAGTLRVNGPASGGQSFFVACLRKTGRNPDDTEPGIGLVEVAPGIAGGIGTEVNWQGLPPGRVEVSGDRLLFSPWLALDNLEELNWQGFVLGRGGKGLRPSARARLLIPPGSPGLVLTDIREVQGLLQGRSLPAPGPGPLAPLYWHDLPLGWVTIKGRRCMWTDRT